MALGTFLPRIPMLSYSCTLSIIFLSFESSFINSIKEKLSLGVGPVGQANWGQLGPVFPSVFTVTKISARIGTMAESLVGFTAFSVDWVT